MDLHPIVKVAELESVGSDVHRNATRTAQLLCSDFREIGRSGRLWSRAETVEALESEDHRPASATDERVFLELTPKRSSVSRRFSSPSQPPPATMVRRRVWSDRGHERQQCLIDSHEVDQRRAVGVRGVCVHRDRGARWVVGCAWAVDRRARPASTGNSRGLRHPSPATEVSCRRVTGSRRCSWRGVARSRRAPKAK